MDHKHYSFLVVWKLLSLNRGFSRGKEFVLRWTENFLRLPAASKWKSLRVIGGFGCPEGSLTDSQWMTRRLSEDSRSLCALRIKLNQRSESLLCLAGVPPESCCALCSHRRLFGLWFGMVYVHLPKPDKVWKKIMSSDPLFSCHTFQPAPLPT